MKKDRTEDKKSKAPRKPNPIATFFKGLVSEIKKVVWPSRKQIINNTIVVLAVCLISGAALFAVDSIFGLLLNLLTKGA